MVLFTPTKATISRKNLGSNEEKDYKGELKETFRHHRTDIYA